MKHIYFILFSLCFFIIRANGQDNYLSGKGMVDVSELDTTLCVRLIYATSDNFMGRAVYQDTTRPWLHLLAANMLIIAQQELRKEYPGRSLLIYDAARPMSVQRKMWALVKDTNKRNYVSNPANGGGLHNYGLAVDVTIQDEEGIPLRMGTPFDFFGKEAHITDEEALMKNGSITCQELENRRLLRRIMVKAGFRTIPYEWWHFNTCSRAEALKKYQVID